MHSGVDRSGVELVPREPIEVQVVQVGFARKRFPLPEQLLLLALGQRQVDESPLGVEVIAPSTVRRCPSVRSMAD